MRFIPCLIGTCCRLAVSGGWDKGSVRRRTGGRNRSIMLVATHGVGVVSTNGVGQVQSGAGCDQDGICVHRHVPIAQTKRWRTFIRVLCRGAQVA